MTKYYIKDKEQYWSHNGEFGYWSKFTDIDSIKLRVKYNYVAVIIQIFFMKILSDINPEMERVKPVFIRDKK